MLRRVVFAAVVLAAGAGLVGQASGQATVTAGAFCSPAGSTGVTSTGIPMTCATTATDTQLRWRATSEVTTTTTAAAVTTTTAAAGGTTTSTTVAGTSATTTTQAPRTIALTG